jgi:adenylate cyclase
MAYRYKEQYEKAIEVCEKAISGHPDLSHAYLQLAASYSSLNRPEEARKAVKEFLRLNPGFSLDLYANTLPYKNQQKLDKYINALRKAGLPE